MSISRLTDFAYALRIVTLLCTPWKEQAAYKQGIIDDEGNLLKRSRDLKTSEEKDAFTYLHRMVFNMKRALEKVPFGKTWTAAATASLILLKEGLEREGVVLSEAQIETIKEGMMVMNEDTPANVTGPAVATQLDVPSFKTVVRWVEEIPPKLNDATVETGQIDPVTRKKIKGFKAYINQEKK